MSYNPCINCIYKSEICDCEFAKLKNKSAEEFNINNFEDTMDSLKSIFLAQNFRLRKLSAELNNLKNGGK